MPGAYDRVEVGALAPTGTSSIYVWIHKHSGMTFDHVKDIEIFFEFRRFQ